MDKREAAVKKIQEGCNTAFIDGTYNSNLAYRPEFITNDYKKGKKKGLCPSLRASRKRPKALVN